MTRIAVLDYGMGNLRSVEKALEHVGVKALRTTDPEIAAGCDGLILPGVGAFPEAMRRIRDRGFDELIDAAVDQGKPLLGICLGLQLLFERSTEIEGSDGLGLLAGEVRELRADGLKLPHIGWSPVSWSGGAELVEGLGEHTPFYFVHSFCPVPGADDDTLGTAGYGETFVCAVARPPVYGVQFHPEKSSSAGLRLLSNFAALCSSPVPA